MIVVLAAFLYVQWIELWHVYESRYRGEPRTL
jgi:hypothetical protein